MQELTGRGQGRDPAGSHQMKYTTNGDTNHWHVFLKSQLRTTTRGKKKKNLLYHKMEKGTLNSFTHLFIKYELSKLIENTLNGLKRENLWHIMTEKIVAG